MDRQHVFNGISERGTVEESVRTCAEGAVVLSAVLSHNADTIGSGLSDLGARVTQGLQHPLDKVLGILEGRWAAVLYDVVEDAQTPLSVGPWPAGTLHTCSVSDGDGMHEGSS